MSPGIEEEGGKTVRSFFDTLKEQPLSLALVVMNVVLLVFMFYSEGKFASLIQIVQEQEHKMQRCNCEQK